MIQEKVYFGKNNGLVGILTLPGKFLTNGDQYSAVIFCHGFAQGKDGKVKGGKFAKIALALAQKNVASLRFDFSGHGESGGEFKDLSILGEVEELRFAFEFLKADQRIDSGKIAIFGHSLGALVAVVAQAKYKLGQNLILLAPAIQQSELIQMPNWFSQEQIALWKNQGFLDIEANGKLLRIGKTYLEEAEKIQWANFCKAVDCPVLIIRKRGRCWISAVERGSPL